MEKRKILYGACAGAAFGTALLTGCGEPKVPDEITVSSLVLDKEGAVTAYLVDTFDQSYYSVDELQQMAAEEVDSYNAEKGGSTVMLQSVELTADGGNVVVSYYFEDTADYAEFLNTQLYYGTPGNAESTIADLNQVLYSADGSKSITTADLSGDKYCEKHVLVVWDQTVVYAPYEVTYVSENVSVADDGSVALTGLGDDELPVVMVMKK